MPAKKGTKKEVEKGAEDSLSVDLRARLQKLTIKNFGCIGDPGIEIDLDDVVVLVGPNNVGKTTILRAYQTITKFQQPTISIEDFPNKNQAVQPEIQIHTDIDDSSAPSSRWIDTSSGQRIVRERWRWSKPDQPAKREGWDVAANAWVDQVPWGAANVAKSKRVEPFRVEAFQSPEVQTEQIVKLLLNGLKDRIKDKRSEDGEEGDKVRAIYGLLGKLQAEIVSEATGEIRKTEEGLEQIVSSVFKGYSVKFDAMPEDNLEDMVNFFKAGAHLRMGPSTGYQSPIEKQGSGARRTILWAALRYLADEGSGEEATRKNLLLLDEPELCLHPDAVREARQVLYDLPSSGNWQVMVTTHSPVFIDLARDNTTVVRIERNDAGLIGSKTVFRPKDSHISADEREELKLLNAFDPYVAEFFFGGRTLLVEGDTEYTVLRYAIEKAADPEKYKNIHVVRARGKVTIALLAKILNRFGANYAVLHDSDKPKILREGVEITNPAWTNNQKILDEIIAAPDQAKVRLVAAVPNLEAGLFGVNVTKDKPYSALQKTRESSVDLNKVYSLLDALLDSTKPMPDGFVAWSTLEALAVAYSASVS